MPIAIPKIGLRTALELGIGLLLLLLVGLQTVRIEGLKIWPLHVAGLKAEFATAKQQLADEKKAFDETVANYRAAADQARAADKANADRVALEQSKVNQERTETRLADADAHYQRLRAQSAAAAHSGSGGAAPVSGARPDRSAAAGASGQDGLPQPASATGADSDPFSLSDRLIATRQAIQLDELVKAVSQLQGIDPNNAAKEPARP